MIERCCREIALIEAEIPGTRISRAFAWHSPIGARN
jgi:hypothetical protein